MNIYLCGVDYHTCPLELRSQLAFTHTQQETMLRILHPACNCVLISTCNRTELYWTDLQGQTSLEQMAKRLCEFKKTDFIKLSPYFYYKEGIDVVRHLFTVAAGLESLAFGEDQILGQIKSAHLLALNEKTCNGLLDKLFSAAQTTAKLIKQQTSISDISTNIGTIAADIVKRSVSKQQGILLIGTGETGIITLKNLKAAGFKNIYATNRTRGRLEDVSMLYHDIITVEYAQRYQAVASVGCIISCTSSPHYTIACQSLKETYDGKPLVIIDLAVPRDVEESVESLPNVTLWDMDGIAGIISRNEIKKHAAGEQAQVLIEQKCVEFTVDCRKREFNAVIQRLEQEKNTIILNQIKKLPEENITSGQVQDVLESAINELLGKVIYPVKASANVQEATAFFHLIDEALRRNEES